MEYTVLWFDDEHETFETLINRALREGIKLKGVSNSVEGLELLRANPDHYDAIILDGLFFSSSEDSLDNVSEDAFGNVAKFLNENKRDYLIPWFIYSGQPSFVKDNNTLVNVFGESFGSKVVYDKNEPSDTVQLWEDIKSAANNIERTKIRKDYPDAFEIFKNNFLDYESEKTLLDLHLKILNGGTFDQPKNDFTKLRKIIEKLVDQCVNKSLVPYKLKGASLTDIIEFLCGQSPDFPLSKYYFHPMINFLLPNLLDMLQDGSHAKSKLRYKADEYSLEVGNGYLFKSCLFQIMDVLIAFNKLFLEEKKGLLPSSKWREVKDQNIFEGPLEQDSLRNYHCGEYILSYKEIHGIIEPGQQLRILNVTENRNSRNKNLYPMYVKKFEKI
ncbi:hypothetical protein [Christiangramia aquimixticola]|uniref:hypothetical protein n=1 Tax=Christiangramia aquimixticola TaxID=1697558 RepID=UPI003AA99522